MRVRCVALVLISGVACGETARRPQSGAVENSAGEPPSSSAGTGGGQGGMAPFTTAGGPAAGAAEEEAGGHGGEGGELSPESEYRFVVLPAVERPELLPNPKEPNDKLSYATEVQAMSADASVMVGVSYAIISRPTEPFAVVHEEEVYWTNLAQPKPLGIDALAEQVCLAEDGSAALFTSSELPGVQRWTQTQGLSSLQAPASTSATLPACSADAQRASFVGTQNDQQRPLYWQQGDKDLTEIEIPPPATKGSRLYVAKDAGPAILLVALPANPAGLAALRPYSWTPDLGAQPLPAPADESCGVDGASGDNSVITGQCESGSFIGSAGTLTVLDEQVQFLGVSRNGRTILGSATDPGGGQRLVSWQNGTVQRQTSAVARSWWNVTGLSADGLSAYVQADAGSALAAKWTADGQVTPLPKLAGYEQTFLTFASAEQGVAVGFASNSQDYYWNGRVVVWDASGVRDVKSELETAGVWPEDISQVTVEGLRVSDQSIFIQGQATVPGYKLYTGVVLVLPRR